MKKTLFLFFLSCIALMLNAQNPVQVNVVVKDAETGEPLIGVNILVEGTQAGTVTGLDGDFSIAVSRNATIRISYVGYKTKTINYEF